MGAVLPRPLLHDAEPPRARHRGPGGRRWRPIPASVAPRAAWATSTRCAAATSSRCATSSRRPAPTRPIPPPSSTWDSCYDRQNQKERAIAAFERAVALKPTLDRAWYGMGLAHAVLGHHGKAAEALGRAAQLQPMNPFAWYNLGMAYAALGDRDKLAETHRPPRPLRSEAGAQARARRGAGGRVMLTFAIVLKGLIEVLLLVLLGQGVLFILAGGLRHQNLFYKVFVTVTKPVFKVTRFITPRFIVDQHLGFVAFFLLVVLWVVALVLKVQAVTAAGVRPPT